MITKQWLAVIMVLALLPLIGIAEATSSLDEQLIEAAERGVLPLVKALLDKGADVNAKEKDGKTALMGGAYGGSPEIIKALIERGAEVNAKEDEGWTALMVAALKGNLSAVEALLDKGADVNAQDKSGFTPLMIASRQGHIEIVRVFLEKGADVDAKSYWGNKASTMASKKGHAQIAELLKAREEMSARQVMILGTIKLIVILIILAMIARIRQDRPLDQPFLDSHKWTLRDAYRIVIPIVALGYLQFILHHTLTQYSSYLSLIFAAIYCAAIFGYYYLFFKNVYGVGATVFGLDKANFLKSGIRNANIALILVLLFIVLEPKLPGPSTGSADKYANLVLFVNLITVLIAVLIGPVLEELLFRGILYTPVARKVGVWKAMGLLAVVVSLGHLHYTPAQTLGMAVFFSYFITVM